MKSKGHLTFSFIKSAVRILGCAAAMIAALHSLLVAIMILAGSMWAAELLGVAEELVDKRG